MKREQCWHTVLILNALSPPKRPSWRGTYRCANCKKQVKVRPTPEKERGK